MNLDLANLPEAFYTNPYPFYAELRSRAPIHRMPDGSYFLTRYADVNAVYRDAKTFASEKKREFAPKFGDTPLYAHHTTSFVFNDPPIHTRVRRIIIGALSPRAIDAMQDALVTLVDGLLDALEARETVDLIADFAAAIPVEVIGNLLGVPHADRAPLRGWSLAILGALEPSLTPEMHRRGNAAVTAFFAYLATLVADRRATPGDPEHDVLTRLIAGDASGDRLDDTELLHNCIFILNAGHETTTNLIGNALAALCDWPEERRALLDEPQLIESAVEEFLRFESSNQLGNRATVAPTVLGGVSLPADARLTLCIGAANRDPAVFPNPDRLDIRRTPNKHLAFATGPHQCAGLHVARLEARIALSRFLSRFPSYALHGPGVRGGRARFRGFASLPAQLGARR